MGTPEFAVPPLKALITSEYEVVAVVTQPDRPSGRGRKLTPSPVKLVALAAGIDVLQPETLKAPEVVAQLAALRPDLIIVAAFGQILRPVAAAIHAGDAETGVTLMLMEAGLDTGPIIAQRAIPIRPTHTRDALMAELAELGAALLIETLPAWLAGQIEARPQDERLATLAPRLKKETGAIDWHKTALEIDRQVRAFHPWPGTFTAGPRGQFKILAAEAATEISLPALADPGVVFRHNRGVYVVTGQGALRLVTVQPVGKKEMPAEAMLNGQPELLGARLGDQVSNLNSQFSNSKSQIVNRKL
jgi:methionyl-tRNA formyltransferase